jgi:hypothetical protein
MLQETARHLRPFVMKVVNLSNEQGSIGKRLGAFFLQMLIIAGILAFVYTFAGVVNSVIGGGVLVKEEVVVVVHEFDTEEEAAKARTAAARGKRSKQTRKDD